MKAKISVILILAILLPVLSGCQKTQALRETAGQTSRITRDEAIQIALQHTGLTRDSVWDLEAELDRERSILVYEISFEQGGIDYSYDVHAETGEILRQEKDRD